MNITETKIAVIGTGMVGSAIAYGITMQGVSAGLLLVDRNYEKALGEALDLQHSIEYMNRNMRVSAGTLKDCHDADMAIITASVPANDVKDRTRLLHDNRAIMDSIVDELMAAGFDGHILVVSNPVDALSHYVYRRSKLPKAQVMGTGTALETARLKQHISQCVRIDPRSIQAYVMGEHGDSLMVPWSHVRVAGKGFFETMEDNPRRFVGVNPDALLKKTKEAGYEVLKRKHSTQYGISGAAVAITSSILRDENRMITISTLLEGEYGQTDVFCGVPAILGKEGVVEIGVFRLTQEEHLQFTHSAEMIRKQIQS